MNKLTIPSILAATVLIAGIFAFMPVEKASTVHVTIGEKIDTIGTEVADMKTAVETMQTEVESIKSGVWAPYERTFMLTDEALTNDGDDYEFACPDTGYRLMRINVEAMGIDVRDNLRSHPRRTLRGFWEWLLLQQRIVMMILLLIVIMLTQQQPVT